MHRRAFLLAAGTAAVAGCQSLQSGRSESVRLGVVELANQTETEQHVNLEIHADDELEHETSVTLEAADAERTIPRRQRLEKAWPDEARSYTLHIGSAVETVEEVLDEPFAETCEHPLITISADRVQVSLGTRGLCYD